MIHTLLGITWALGHYWVVLLLLVTCLCYLLVKRLLWQRDTVAALASHFYRHKFLHYFSLIRKKISTFLLLLASVCLTLAIMKPQWNTHEQSVDQKGRDIFIALDISRSMLAQDMTPNRLEFAKEKIKKFVTNLPSDRIGLVVFSGSPFVQCPLTTDYGAFFKFLDITDSQTIGTGSTVIAQALECVIQSFTRVADKKNKLLLLVTDGEDFSQDLSDIKKKAAALGLIIFTLGIGTVQGAPIPVYDDNGILQGHQKDAQQNTVISRLDELMLKKIAKESGAFYVRATVDDQDIQRIIRAVSRFEKEKFESKKILVGDEKYYYFGLTSLLCLVIEWLL